MRWRFSLTLVTNNLKEFKKVPGFGCRNLDLSTLLQLILITVTKEKFKFLLRAYRFVTPYFFWKKKIAIYLLKTGNTG